MSEEIYRLWLSSLYQLGSRKQNALLTHFETARAVFNAPLEALRQVPGFLPSHVQTLAQGRDLSLVEALLRTMEAKKIVYISREHAHFPALLKEIPDPPVGLFYIGELPAPSSPSLGVIGSRRCSEYGLSAARLLCKPLARYNVVVISGMARGVDSMAHQAILDGGGQTVAVLGCGVDICYPAENRRLYEDIIRSGCVLSEYPPGVKPVPAHFPARNRIISGLSTAVVVVEAAARSGTLITVNQAQDQGREVMAVPGSIVSKLSEGTNQLIRDGATPAVSCEDILAVLGIRIKSAAPNAAPNPSEPKAGELAPDEKLVYDCLNFEPVSLETLAQRTNSQSHVILYICTLLEVKGFIRKLPGQRYVKNV